jgi:hypothetical protein
MDAVLVAVGAGSILLVACLGIFFGKLSWMRREVTYRALPA